MRKWILLIAAVLADAQTTMRILPTTLANYVGNVPAYIPTSATDVCDAGATLPCNMTVFGQHLHLANGSGSAVTITFFDKTTNCNSAACQPWPAVTIAAHTVYSVDLGGLPFYSGMQWQASAANAVVGWVTLRF